MTSSDRTGRCLVIRTSAATRACARGPASSRRLDSAGRALPNNTALKLIARAARRMRCAGFSRSADVVAFVRVDDPLDSRSRPPRPPRCEWTASHRPSLFGRSNNASKPLAWCRVGCLGHLVGVAGGLPGRAGTPPPTRTYSGSVGRVAGYRSLVRNQFDPGGVDALAVEQLLRRLQNTLTSATAPPGGSVVLVTGGIVLNIPTCLLL